MKLIQIFKMVLKKKRKFTKAVVSMGNDIYSYEHLKIKKTLEKQL